MTRTSFLYKTKAKTLNDSFLSFVLSLYIILLPFEEAFSFQGISILRIIALAVISIYFIKYHKCPLLKEKWQLLLSIWGLYSIMSCVWANNLSDYWYFIRIYLFNIALCLCITAIPPSKIKTNYLYDALLIVGMIISLLFMLGNDSVITEEGRRAIVIGSTELDPNVCGGILLLSFLSLLCYCLNDYSLKGFKKIIILIVLFLELYGILSTGSRGTFLSMLVGVVLIFAQEYKMQKEAHKKKKILYQILFVIIFFTLSFLLLPNELVKTRFALNVLFGQTERHAHSRTVIWSFVPSLFISKPLFGWGAGNFLYAISTVYRRSASHNMYLCCLVEGGFIGFAIYLFFLFCIFKKSYCSGKNPFLVPFIAILISCFFLDGLTDKFFWTAVWLVWVGKDVSLLKLS